MGTHKLTISFFNYTIHTRTDKYIYIYTHAICNACVASGFIDIINTRCRVDVFQVRSLLPYYLLE